MFCSSEIPLNLFMSVQKRLSWFQEEFPLLVPGGIPEVCGKLSEWAHSYVGKFRLFISMQMRMHEDENTK